MKLLLAAGTNVNVESKRGTVLDVLRQSIMLEGEEILLDVVTEPNMVKKEEILLTVGAIISNLQQHRVSSPHMP